MNFVCTDFAADRLAVGLNVLAEFRLHGLRNFNIEILLQHPCDAALAGLRVDADQPLKLAAKIGRINMEIRHLPAHPEAIGCFGKLVHALIDCILMRSGKGGEGIAARIGLAIINRHAR